jgi:hypothetical protein
MQKMKSTSGRQNRVKKSEKTSSFATGAGLRLRPLKSTGDCDYISQPVPPEWAWARQLAPTCATGVGLRLGLLASTFATVVDLRLRL